jgi:tyrosyl-tRNA synthetase
MNLYEDLKWRGLVAEASEGVDEVLEARKVSGYIGFDPTAASLHVGTLMPIMLLARMQRHGHTPIALVGGGTGLIGDPSGKTKERQLLSAERVEENVRGIRAQLEPFLDFESRSNPAKLVNNADWLTGISFIEFLRDVGKYFTINYLLAKESVKRRVEQDGGLSFTEFSYSLLQAYDYLVLHDREGCTLQMGGSDQWGNITSGIELIRKLRQRPAHGLVCPLVTTSSGVKFGKTEAGTIWLDPELTSPYELFQFWLNVDDRDVLDYLRYFTWLGPGEIDELAAAMEERPGAREPQRRLAREVTAAVHGEGELERAERASRVLFGGEVEGLGSRELLQVFKEVPSSEVPPDRLAGDGLPIADLLAESGLVSSKSEARRSIDQGGIYLNNRRVVDARASVTREDAIDGELLVLRKGKKAYHLVRVAGAAGHDPKGGDR